MRIKKEKEQKHETVTHCNRKQKDQLVIYILALENADILTCLGQMAGGPPSSNQA